MAIVVTYFVVYRVFGWVKQNNIRLVVDASLLRNIKEKEQRLVGSKPHIIWEKKEETRLNANL
jgi:hypothetical protein